MKYLKFLYSPLLMGILFVMFAIAMAVATFLENDLGSAAAYSMVYDTRWFELILLLLAVNLVGQVVIMKLLKREKLTIGLFHLSFVLMIIGAGITRYFGWEGSMHIRKGEEQQQCFSNEKYIGYTIKDKNGSIIASQTRKYSMTSVTADRFDKKIKIDGREYELLLARIIPNASEMVSEGPDGEPMVSLVISDKMMSRETLTLKKGDVKSSGGISFGFASSQHADINISLDSGKFFMVTNLNLGEMSMMTQESASLEHGKPV